jgi:hypothetical protein
MTIKLVAGRVKAVDCGSRHNPFDPHGSGCHARHTDELDVPGQYANRAGRRSRGQRSLPKYPHAAGSQAARKTGHLPGARIRVGYTGLTKALRIGGSIDPIWSGDSRPAKWPKARKANLLEEFAESIWSDDEW